MADISNLASDRPALGNAAVIVVVGVLATTLAQPQVLAQIPLQNLLKNELHVDRAANAAFFFWMGLAWYFKPVAGILTDAFAIFGSRRRSYLLLSTTLGVMAWAALYFMPHDYDKLLWNCIVINIFMVVASTVVGGYMVEIAQAISGSGRLTAIRQLVQQVAIIFKGPTAGYLASIAFGWTAAACGGAMFLLVPATFFFLREQHRRFDSDAMLQNAGRQLIKLSSAKLMWVAAGIVALFHLAPGLSTAVFYIQQNDLNLDTQGQGFLQFIYGVFGVVAALTYGYFCRRLNLRALLVGCISICTLTNLSYLFYTSPGNARIVEGLCGFGFTLAELALMDLAVRATPKGSEGLGFSLLMSIRNASLFGTDWFGSKLLESFKLPFRHLVLANCSTTLITVPLVLILPALLVDKKDAEPPQSAPLGQVALQQE